MIWNIVINKYQQYHLSHLLFFLILLLYSFIGAGIFCSLERGNEISKSLHENQIRLGKKNAARDKLAHDLQYYFHGYINVTILLSDSFSKTLDIYDSNMGVKECYNNFFKENVVIEKWTLWGGLYYSATIYTTIGYGDLVVETAGGKIATVIYAIFGIPLVITILNNWGSGLFQVISILWKRYLVSFIIKIREAFNQNNVAKNGLLDNDSFESMGDYKKKNNKKHSVSLFLDKCLREKSLTDEEGIEEGLPISLSIFILFFWISLCACVFTFLEDWSLWESLYFFFISFTTIGLGDITPTHRIACMNFLLIIMGLSVVSLSINIIQLQVEIIFARIIKTIDQDFKNALTAEKSKFSVSTDANTFNDIEKLSRPSINPTNDLQNLTKNMSTSEKIMMKFMSNHMKKTLNEKIDNNLKMRNRGVQTDDNKRTIMIQTDVVKRLTDLEKLPTPEGVIESDDQEDMNCTGKIKKKGSTYKKMYIYNVDD
uniref:Potassium channel subfamily K member 18 n=1 Tax=Parastrongyloides trichosuri TaxID=131310 RepID=A0A0N4ZQ85_PARTI